MVTETDDRGRVYLSKEMRDKHGDRFRVVDRPSQIVLIPVDDDPLAAVSDAVGDAFAGKSVAELKREAREAAAAEVAAEIEEREQRAGTSEQSAGE
jgi:predicted RNase H-like HicB family nuclease